MRQKDANHEWISAPFAPNRPNDNNKKDDDDDDDSKGKTFTSWIPISFIISSPIRVEKAGGAQASASNDAHDAKITIDLHSIVELIKHELHASEERIISAVRNHDHHHDHNDQQTSSTSSSSPPTASYRIAPRLVVQ